MGKHDEVFDGLDAVDRELTAVAALLARERTAGRRRAAELNALQRRLVRLADSLRAPLLATPPRPVRVEDRDQDQHERR